MAKKPLLVLELKEQEVEDLLSALSSAICTLAKKENPETIKSMLKLQKRLWVKNRVHKKEQYAIWLKGNRPRTLKKPKGKKQ